MKKKKKKKKKALKMTSQLVIFRAFLFIYFSSPDPKSEKNIPVNQLIKNSGLIRTYDRVTLCLYIPVIL